MAPLDGEGERILIVEDDPRGSKLLVRLLGQAGYRCSAAPDAADARRQLTEEQFDLLLADVNLPGESGLQLVKHVLAEYPHMAAVMATGMDDPRSANAAIEIGAYGYIMKPFTANQVLFGVKNALSRRKLEIENNAQRETLEQIVRARTAGPGALRQATEAFTGGDGAAPVPRGRVPRRGDRWPHRADERLFRDAGRQARRRRGVDPHREPDARRGQGGATGPHPAAPRRPHPGRAPRDGASHADRVPDPLRAPAARCSSSARRSRSRTTRSGTAPAIRTSWPATRSRSMARWPRSQTCSTR